MNPSATRTTGGIPYTTAGQGTYPQGTQQYGEAVPVYVVEGAQNNQGGEVYAQAVPAYAAQGNVQGQFQMPSAFCKGVSDAPVFLLCLRAQFQERGEDSRVSLFAPFPN